MSGRTADAVRLGLCGFTMAFEDSVREYRLVEVQQTFYEPPRDGTMRRWRALAPTDFEFTILERRRSQRGAPT